jgi:hypothetical protein
MDTLPEFYIADAGHRIDAPTYEALTQCYIIMASDETGQVGPTLIEPGHHFSTDQTPSDAWKPLNKAAGEALERWHAKQPGDPSQQKITQEDMNEAAYQLRPREGDELISKEQWQQNVLLLASRLAEKRRDERRPVNPAVRPMRQGDQAPMPFSAHSQGYPMEAGRAPPAASVAPPSANAPRQRRPGQRPAPNPGLPLANATSTDTPQSATG